MSQNGPDKGTGSTVYQQAWAFFKKHELRGLVMPNPTKKTKAATQEKQVDLSTVVLPGEMQDSVEIYGAIPFLLVGRSLSNQL
jgi:hypothetical protein